MLGNHGSFESEIRLKIAHLNKEIDNMVSTGDSPALSSETDGLEGMIGDFELAAEGDPSHQKKARHFRTQLRMIRKTLQEKTTALELEKGGFGAPGETQSLVETDQLELAKKKLYESQAMTINISSELDRSGQVLRRSMASAQGVARELGVSDQLIGAISRLRRRQGIIARLVFFIVGLAVCLLFYKAVLRRLF